jgi:predicted alpha/beta superfamily hydrolase
MRYLILFLPFLLLLVISCTSPRDESARVIFSESVKDSFEIYIDLPGGFVKDGNNSIVFYTDANLRIGREIRKQINLGRNNRKLSNVIFVGIGHIGDYLKLRRRDFIPPPVNDSTILSDNKYFGHADNFYRFLTSELIPYLNKNYPNNGRYTYIGHSLGGLFAFHCLMKPKTIFVNHVALSPSLWINYNNFFSQEEEFFLKGNHEFNATLYHACGTLEWHNKIIRGSRRMKEVLDKHNYRGLKYIYKEYEGKGHNNMVAVALDQVFREIDL